MGTNYYARFDTCPMCGHYEQVHIGKKSWGWVFAFRAHKEDDVSGYGALETVRDYRDFTKHTGIFDEDGDEIEYKDFWRMVEDSKNEPHNCVLEYPAEAEYMSEGFPFSRREFS